MTGVLKPRGSAVVVFEGVGWRWAVLPRFAGTLVGSVSLGGLAWVNLLFGPVALSFLEILFSSCLM